MHWKNHILLKKIVIASKAFVFVYHKKMHYPLLILETASQIMWVCNHKKKPTTFSQHCSPFKASVYNLQSRAILFLFDFFNPKMHSSDKYLLASATGAMPERVLLRRTSKKEDPPRKAGATRTISSFFLIHLSKLSLKFESASWPTCINPSHQLKGAKKKMLTNPVK